MGDSSDSLDGIDWDEQERLAIGTLEGANKGSLTIRETPRTTHSLQSAHSILHGHSDNQPDAPRSDDNTHQVPGADEALKFCSDAQRGPQSSHPSAGWIAPHKFCSATVKKDNSVDPSKWKPVTQFGSPLNRQGRGRGRGRVISSPGGRKYGKSPTKENSGMKWVIENLPPPAIPFKKCPGVYQECGGTLRLGGDECMRLWYCGNFPSCKFRYHLEPQKNVPVLSLEIVSSGLMKVSAVNGAESAVLAHGGVLSVLKKARLDLTVHRPVSMQHELWLKSGLCSEEFGTDVVFFSMEDYDKIEHVLNQHGRTLLLRGSSVMRSVLRHIRNPGAIQSNPKEAELRWKKLPLGLVRALMPFQVSGIRFGLERGGRCLLADEMGLGKTLQAIALAVCYQDEWPLIIVTPASLRLVWAEELEKWLPMLRPSDIHVIEGKQHALRGECCIPKITISSFEMVKRLSCEPCCKGLSFKGGMSKFHKECYGFKHCIVAKGFGMVIVDESHNLRTTKSRSHDAAHTEACVSIIKRAKRSVLLSGTPSLSKPFELYRQVDALRPGILTADKNLFADRYCCRKLMRNSNRDGMFYDLTGASHFHELHFLLTQTIMIRRLKKNVMSQLPPKRRQVVRLSRPASNHWPPETNRKRSVSSDFDTEESDGEQDLDSDLGSQEESRMSYDRRTGIAKLPNAIAWLKDSIGFQDNASDIASQSATLHDVEPPKILVFAHHRDVMDGLATEFEAMLGSTGYVRIDGQSDSTDRMQAVNKFRCNPDVRLALLSITAAGVGLDFSTASVVVFVELPRDVAFVRQAEDRAHRKGQAKAVNVYFLCAKGTADDARWQHLGRSLENISVVHDGPMGGEETARSSWRRQPKAVCDHAAGAGLQIDGVFEIPEADDTAPVEKSNGQNVLNGLQRPSKFPVLKDFTSSAMTAAGERIKIKRNTDCMESLFWFEASKSTSRVHIFGSEDGELSLVSIPIECLLHDNSPMLHTLKNFLKNRLNEASTDITGVIEPFGLIEVSKKSFESVEHIDLMISTAQEFAQEWVELRSIFRSKLYGMVLCPPLHGLVDKISSEFLQNYVGGGSTERYLTIENRKLPKGVIPEPVKILFPGELNPRDHKQPVSIATKQVLCLLCFKPVCDLCIPTNGLLRSHMYLFCSGECEVSFGVKTSRSALRRELFQLERGVCQLCKLNCHELVKKLRAVRLRTRGWKSKREHIIQSLASKLASHGYKKLLHQLIHHAVDGFAWHADHILPVYKGGGQCGVENLRTLCVACHADVTKQQMKERKAERDLQKLVGNTIQQNLVPDLEEANRVDDSEVHALKQRSKKPRGSRLKPIYGERLHLSKDGDVGALLKSTFSEEKVLLSQNLVTCVVETSSSSTPCTMEMGPEQAALCMNSHSNGAIVPSDSWPSGHGNCEDLSAYIKQRQDFS